MSNLDEVIYRARAAFVIDLVQLECNFNRVKKPYINSLAGIYKDVKSTISNFFHPFSFTIGAT